MSKSKISQKTLIPNMHTRIGVYIRKSGTSPTPLPRGGPGGGGQKIAKIRGFAENVTA